jgi:uncharacterized membrane protein YfcA
VAVGPSLGDVVLSAAAGFGAGAANAIAGGGTLLTFPALLAAGVSPVLANTTSAVGLLAGYAGGSFGYRRELAGQRGRLRALALVSLAGGVAGAVLLLVTSEAAFGAVVPFLVLLSCALLVAQPGLARRVARRRTRARPGPRRTTREITAPLVAGVGLASVYGSYFGAGLGVLLLGVLGVLLSDDLQRLNALKGLLSLVVNAVGVVVFVATGHVVWTYAGIIAVTSLLGGLAGSSLARRIPPVALRTAVVVLGTVVALALLR